MSKNTIKMNNVVFYQEKFDKGFRFGDVLKGFVSSTPTISDPLLKPDQGDYAIEVSKPSYCAIISPCCSISDKVISLSPLVPIRNSFFNNPYFAEDLTRINRRLAEPRFAFPPHVWFGFPDGKKQEYFGKEPFYTLVDLFIYKEHEIFPEYEVHMKGCDNIKTKYYMIDFRNTFKVNCSTIKSPQNVPTEAKCLQLTIESRRELREKISQYYGRTPNEDLID